MKTVLVLMATYNGEKYLSEQLDSVFRQKDVDVKLLVRDDGSTDKTRDILREWEKEHNLEWYTGEHLNVKFGFYDLMEHAVKTEYKYFAFCDQDDVWDCDKLICALKALEHVDESVEGLYYCGQRLVDKELTLLDIHTLNKHRTIYARFVLNDAAGCTEVFNRALLHKVVQYKPGYILMHDAWIVKVCLAVGGKVLVDPQPHMSYRQHGNNVVGLKRDIKSKLIRAKQYLEKQDVETQMRELENGYTDEIVPEYKCIIADALTYKTNVMSRYRLMNRKKFDFANTGINVTYLLKVLLNKL